MNAPKKKSLFYGHLNRSDPFSMGSNIFRSHMNSAIIIPQTSHSFQSCILITWTNRFLTSLRPHHSQSTTVTSNTARRYFSIDIENPFRVFYWSSEEHLTHRSTSSSCLHCLAHHFKLGITTNIDISSVDMLKSCPQEQL